MIYMAKCIQLIKISIYFRNIPFETLKYHIFLLFVFTFFYKILQSLQVYFDFRNKSSMNRDHRRTHDECRSAVCICCGYKGCEPVSGILPELVKKYVLECYDPNDDRLPCALCNTCKTILYLYKNENYSRSLNIQNFSKYAGYTTRTSCDEGKCVICNCARQKGHPPSNKLKRGRPISTERKECAAPTPDAKKMCTKCFSPVRRGLSHLCTRQSKLENTLVMLSPKSKEQVCSTVLKSKADVLKTPAKQVKLGTKGKPLTVSLGNCSSQGAANSQNEMHSLSAKNFCDLQVSNNLSSNQVKAVATMVRGELGKNFVEPNLREKVSEQGKVLEPHFQRSELCLYEKSKQQIVPTTRPGIMVRDTSALINFIMEHRRYDPQNTLIKLGMDGGQGFFKITLNLVKMKPDTDDTADKKRVKAAAADSGVKGLMLLCVVPDIQELYENVEVCIDGLNLNDIDYKVATDLKLANVLSGIQSHGCLHPCCYCETTSGIWEPARQRTLGNIKQNFEMWKTSGAKMTTLKKFFNCGHLPLLKGDPSDKIIDFIPPPELHLLMGPFNHIFKEMKKIWPDADMWPAHFHIKSVGYHGGDNFIGGDCNKLLKNVDTLEQMCPMQVLPYVHVLRMFNTVVRGCYGDELSSTLTEDTAKFETAYKGLGISITPKVHIVMHHVPEFCMESGRGLSLYSEQASESVHSIFKLFWQKRKINLRDNPHYARALFDTVVEFNSKHLM